MKKNKKKLNIKHLLIFIINIISFIILLHDNYFLLIKGASYTWIGFISGFINMIMFAYSLTYIYEKIK